jgi:hypothetical protein
MESIIKINEKIIHITNTIREQFPELTDFLNEMPVSVPNVTHPIIDEVVLEKYYNSLKDLLKEYKNQIILKQKQHD